MTTTHDRAVFAEHAVGATGRVAIRLASAELRLAGTDGDRVTVRSAAGRALPDRVIIEPGDGSLTIREKDFHGLSFRRGQRVVQLEIAVPTRAEVSVDTVSGWLDVVGLSGDQRYRTASAEARLKGAAGRVDLVTVSGDADVELDGSVDLGIKSVSGDIAVRGGRIGALRVSTTTGRVRIESPIVGLTGHTIETLSGDVDIVAGDGVAVEARTVSGDLATDLPHTSEGRMGRRSLVVGNGAIKLAFRSVSGDLRIRGAKDAIRTVHSGPSSAAVTDGRMESQASSPYDAVGAVDDGFDEASDDARMAILRALESGELDVATALDRLAVLDGGRPSGGTGRSDG